MNEWIKVASIEYVCPRTDKRETHRVIAATLSRRGSKWQCIATEARKGYYFFNGPQQSEGRGKSAEHAVETCRKDVLAWAVNDRERGEYATVLRNLVYKAEDIDEAKQREEMTDESTALIVAAAREVIRVYGPEDLNAPDLVNAIETLEKYLGDAP